MTTSITYTPAEVVSIVAGRADQPEQTRVDDMPLGDGWRLSGDFWRQEAWLDDDESHLGTVLWHIVPGDDAEGSAVDWDTPAYVIVDADIIGGSETED